KFRKTRSPAPSPASTSARNNPEIRSCRGIHRTKNVRWKTVPPLRDGQYRRPSGRNDNFCTVDDVGKPDFDEVGPSQDNHLKQNEIRSPAIGQIRSSGSTR